MDLFFILLIIATFYKSSFVKNEINTNFLSIDQCHVLRGTFIIAVVFHHIAQRTTGGVFFHHIFSFAGFLGVSIFFFLSGYGLFYSLKNKKNYIKDFIHKRMSKVVLPMVFYFFLYWMIYSFFESQYTLEYVLTSLVNGNPIVTFSWFMYAIIWMYLSFYIIVKLTLKDAYILIGIAFSCIVYALCCHLLNFGSWWYNTIQVFWLGMVYYKFKDTVDFFVKRNYTRMLISLIIMMIVLLIDIRIGVFKLFARMLLASIFTCFIVLASMKIKLYSRAMIFIGKMSLEVYLIHGLFLTIFEQYLKFENEVLMTTVVLTSSLITAIILHNGFKRICR